MSVTLMLLRAVKLFYDFISSGIMFNSCFITIRVRDSLLVTYLQIGCQIRLFLCSLSVYISLNKAQGYFRAYKWYEFTGEMYVLASDWSPLSPSIYGHKYQLYKRLSLLTDSVLVH